MDKELRADRLIVMGAKHFTAYCEGKPVEQKICVKIGEHVEGSELWLIEKDTAGMSNDCWAF